LERHSRGIICDRNVLYNFLKQKFFDFFFQFFLTDLAKKAISRIWSDGLITLEAVYIAATIVARDKDIN
jgi:hypothetical protein